MKKSTPRPAARSHRAIFLRNGGGANLASPPAKKKEEKCCVPPLPCYTLGMTNEMKKVLADLAASTARFEKLADDIKKSTEIFVMEIRKDRKEFSEKSKKSLA